MNDLRPELIALGPEELHFSFKIEAEIRKEAPTKNRIQHVLRNFGVTDFLIHTGGKVGPNTKIWITAPGMRIPAYGFFLCFI